MIARYVILQWLLSGHQTYILWEYILAMAVRNLPEPVIRDQHVVYELSTDALATASEF